MRLWDPFLSSREKKGSIPSTENVKKGKREERSPTHCGQDDTVNDAPLSHFFSI
jgi:hypothetical protein